LIRDPRLIGSDVRVALAIVALIPAGRWETNASPAAIGELVALKCRQIAEAVARLADCGWVVVRKQGKKGRTIYPLWLPEDREGGGR
jgi:hypothetical protein